jgi:hypothetical protein
MTGGPNAVREMAPQPGRSGRVTWPAAGVLGSAVGSLALARPAKAAAVLTVLLLYVSAFRMAWIDDAYIQLQYARTLLESGTWGFYAGYPANTATSPLNVLLIAAIGFPLGSVERAVTLLTASNLLDCSGSCSASRAPVRRDFFGWFAFVALAANPLLLSTIGMESLLFVLLFVAALVCFLEDQWSTAAVSLGLLTLARPDGVLLLGILLALSEAPLRRKAAGLLLYAGTIAPWFVFSWIQLGSFLPDTLVIKIGDAAWGPTSFADGLALYLDRYPWKHWARYSWPHSASFRFGSADRRSSRRSPYLRPTAHSTSRSTRRWGSRRTTGTSSTSSYRCS